jgi:hypothetical protein
MPERGTDTEGRSSGSVVDHNRRGSGAHFEIFKDDSNQRGNRGDTNYENEIAWQQTNRRTGAAWRKQVQQYRSTRVN